MVGDGIGSFVLGRGLRATVRHGRRISLVEPTRSAVLLIKELCT